MGSAPPNGRPLPVVHAVTSDEIVARADFLERARDVMRAVGARGALQLRAPQLATSDAGALLNVARALVDTQLETGAWLIINDRVDIALIAGAWGIQLAGTSMEPADAARVILHSLDRAATLARGEGTAAGQAPDAPAVGASVHSLEEGISARLGGASWAVVSHVLGSRATPARGGRYDDAAERAEAPTGAALAQQLVRHSGIPIVAIGGIVPQHVVPLRKLGISGVAAIRGIWDAENAGRAALDYLSAYDSEVGG